MVAGRTISYNFIIFHHMSVTNHNVSHHPSEVSEEKQRREETKQGSQESGAKIDKIAGCLEICVQCWEHDLHISAPSNWEGTKVSECKR